MLLAVVATLGSLQPASAAPYEFPLIQTGTGLTLHKEMFVQPFTYAEVYDGSQAEVVFQLSAKHDIFGSGFYLAYSQISFWQAYDRNNSSPFRDTNYNPEVFYRAPETTWGSGLLGADAGFEHESNGQPVPMSRSWNLLYLAPYYHGDNWLAYVKLRYRVPEEKKETPLSPLGDDNPDITDYLGYSDVHLYYLLANEHLLHFLTRGFVGTGKGNVSLTYSLPVPRSEGGFIMFRLFHGYGESLLDYNRTITRIGIGLMFNR
jgi:phospholipase A1